ncbi:helix-turn-helix domain-containing protein [Methylobacterium nonmethylotrophicum]|uniref:MarR family transcriptional regulator n=1 Tax=Methylobacterium nonmethylotrophicum TaxID=1141884 RepID=A0A4Z0NVE0_9HYPH|nr:helix-turn-helix domain-containing protein [Methylobacterium nonmethylotrophicum]TGE01652.1 MarR family transcriptional regulator [Methylobacterium nonmethylotrophicum]
MPSFQPVTAALRVLEVLAALNRLKEASVGDLFRETGLNRPTIVRMLETLIHAGLVARHPERPVYVTTGRTLELSSGYQKHEEMALAAAPILARLHAGLQWPSDVSVFDGDAMVVARTSRREGVLHFNRRPGYRAPLLGTSLGMAFLAFCDATTRAGALAALSGSSDPWNAVARDPAAVEALLETVRRNGYASMNKDYSDTSYNGVASAIGVPVLLGGVAVGSLNLMYLRNSLDEADVVARFVAPLRTAAEEIAGALAGMRGG